MRWGFGIILLRGQTACQCTLSCVRLKNNNQKQGWGVEVGGCLIIQCEKRSKKIIWIKIVINIYILKCKVFLLISSGIALSTPPPPHPTTITLPLFFLFFFKSRRQPSMHWQAVYPLNKTICWTCTALWDGGGGGGGGGRKKIEFRLVGTWVLVSQHPSYLQKHNCEQATCPNTTAPSHISSIKSYTHCSSAVRTT